MTTIYKDFHFDAAHYLPFIPEGHKCGRMHGHTYRVRVWCLGAIDSRGMIVDYADIAAAVNEVLELIDHRVLNEIPGLGNPTTEILAPWLYNQLKPGMPELFRIEVAESATTGCVYGCESGV